MDNESLLNTNVVTQIGILVRDIETTAKAYAGFFNMAVPSIEQTGSFDESQQHYKGDPVESRAKLAFFNMGNIQIELIEPDSGPSTWREHLDTHGEGVHHIAFEINGMKHVISNLEERDMPLVQKGEYEGGRYAYIDSFKELKVMIELLEND